MDDKTIVVDGILLLGKEAYVIPCLAVLGAASIIGGTIYSSYRLAKAVVEMANDKETK